MEKKILNLTQHSPTLEQIQVGVFEPSGGHKKEIQRLLTFDAVPSVLEMYDRANQIALVAKTYGVKFAMIGGAPFFMQFLERALSVNRIEPVYAFSRREVVEQRHVDGKVEKKAIFRHVGFVRVFKMYDEQI